MTATRRMVHCRAMKYTLENGPLRHDQLAPIREIASVGHYFSNIYQSVSWTWDVDILRQMSYLVAAVKQIDALLKQEPSLPSSQYAIIFLADEVKGHAETARLIAHVQLQMTELWRDNKHPLLVMLMNDELEVAEDPVTWQVSEAAECDGANTTASAWTTNSVSPPKKSALTCISEDLVKSVISKRDSHAAHAIIVHPKLMYLLTQNSGAKALPSRLWTCAWLQAAMNFHRCHPDLRAHGVYIVKQSLFSRVDGPDKYLMPRQVKPWKPMDENCINVCLKDDHGISNFMHVIVAALWLGHHLEVPVCVYWISSKDRPCTYSDLFKLRPENRPPWLKLPYFHVHDDQSEECAWMKAWMAKAADQTMVWQRFCDCAALIPFMAKCLHNKCMEAQMPMPHFLPIAPFAILAMNPTDDLKRLATRYWNNAKGSYKQVVGVHLRRGDLKKMFQNQTGHNADELGKIADQKLLAEVLTHLQTDGGKSTVVFIACDSKDSHKWLTSATQLRKYIQAAQLKFHPAHDHGWNGGSDVSDHGGLRETSQMLFVEEMLMLSMCETVIFTATSTATMLIQAMRKQPFVNTSAAGTTKPNACLKPFPFPEMKEAVSKTIAAFGHRINRLVCKPLGGRHPPNAAETEDAYEYGERPKVGDAARELLVECFRKNTSQGNGEWKIMYSALQDFLHAERGKPYMSPLKEWIATVLDNAPCGDLWIANRAIHALVNCMTRAGLKTGSITKVQVRSFVARFPYIYCVNWTGIDAMTWKELHETHDSDHNLSQMLAGIAWRPHEPVPMYQANLIEDVWLSAPRLTNLYDQGLIGDRLMDIDTIDDVTPSTKPCAHGKPRGIKRPTPSHAGPSTTSTDTRAPLARPALAFMHDAAMCKQ